MTPDIQALMRLAAERGHRTPTGHHCHTLASLLGIVPEHDNHARRRLAGLVVQTEGLARAAAAPSHHGGTEYRDLDQRPGDRA
jgi:hypothetical protein